MIKVDKEELDKKIDELLANRKLKKIFKGNYGPDAYKYINMFVEKETDEWYMRWCLTQSLFLCYVKNGAGKTKRKNFYEEILCSMMHYLEEETLEYILSQNLNYNFNGYDSYGTPVTLIDALALNIKNPKIMKIVLSKITDSNALYFGNVNYETYTDLCEMNIVAEDIDQAIEVFKRDDYILVPNESLRVIIQDLKDNENGVYIEGFNANQDDRLFKILKKIGSAKLDTNSKIKFLDGILDSDKIKLVNVRGLEVIKDIYDADKYDDFITYLSSKVNEEKIILYDSEKAIGDIGCLFYVDGNTLKKSKVKVIK